MLIFTVCFSILLNVNSHVCVLKRRLDNSTGTERWSLPSGERCYCTFVMAPKFLSVNGCAAAVREKRIEGQQMWFNDGVKSMTNRSYWNAELLDVLLDRADFCSKLINIHVFLVVFEIINPHQFIRLFFKRIMIKVVKRVHENVYKPVPQFPRSN